MEQFVKAFSIFSWILTPNSVLVISYYVWIYAFIYLFVINNQLIVYNRFNYVALRWVKVMSIYLEIFIFHIYKSFWVDYY